MVLFPNHYTLTTFVHDASGVYVWRNHMDIVDAAGTFPAPGDPIVRAWVSFIAGMTRGDSRIFQSTLRPWTRGKNAFGTADTIWENAENSQGVAYAGGGVFGGGGDGVTNTGVIVAKLSKSNFATGGKVGHLFIRNLANEANTSAVAGGPPHWDQAAFASDPNVTINSYIAAHLGTYLQNNPLPRFCNVHYSAKTNTGPFESAIGVITSQDLSLNSLRRSSKK